MYEIPRDILPDVHVAPTPAGAVLPDPELDRFRKLCDPLADAAIAELCDPDRASCPARPGNLLASCRDAALMGAPACLRFLSATRHIPDWVDFDAMEPGRQLFMRHNTMGLMLGFTVLVDSYAGSRDNKVLLMSGRLSRHGAFRRLAETALFLMRVIEPGGLEPGGAGIEAILEVRLLHARVRQLCRLGGYDTELYDEPINQEAMCGTLMLFSHGLLRSLERLGVEIDDAERESYHHLWRYAGVLLGVDRELLPASWRDTARLYERVKAHQYLPDADTTMLFEAAVAGVADGAREHATLLDGSFLLGSEAFLRQLTAFCVDRTLVRHLELELAGHWHLGLQATRAWMRLRSHLLRRSPRLGAVAAALQHNLAWRILDRLVGERSVHFHDPGFRRSTAS